MAMNMEMSMAAGAMADGATFSKSMGALPPMNPSRSKSSRALPSAGAPGGGAPAPSKAPTLRSDFKGTAYHGLVKLDANGKGSVTFKVPDNVGRWEVRTLVSVRGKNKDAVVRFGSGATSFNARRPISVQSVIPQVARVEDRFEAGAVVTPFGGWKGSVVVVGSLSWKETIPNGPDSFGNLTLGGREGEDDITAPSALFATKYFDGTTPYAVGDKARKGAVVVELDGSSPLRVMLPLIATRLGKDKMKVQVYAAVGAEALPKGVALAQAALKASESTDGSAVTGAGVLVDVAEYEVWVEAHYPTTALVSGFVLVPKASADGSAQRQEGIALPKAEEGVGSVDARVTTSWLSAVVAVAADAAKWSLQGPHPAPLATTAAVCLMKAYGEDGKKAISEEMRTADAAERKYMDSAISDPKLIWWRTSAFRNAALCARAMVTSSGSADGETAAAADVELFETAQSKLQKSVVDALVDSYARGVVWGGYQWCPSSAIDLLSTLGPVEYQRAVLESLERDDVPYDSTNTTQVEALQKVLSVGHALSATMSGLCSLGTTVVLADSLVWHAGDVRKHFFEAEMTKLVGDLWASLRVLLRVQGRPAYIAYADGAAWPLSGEVHARLLGVYSALKKRAGPKGPDADVFGAALVKAEESFVLNDWGRIVHWLVAERGVGGVWSASGLVSWDYSTDSAADPDLDVSVFMSRLALSNSSDGLAKAEGGVTFEKQAIVSGELKTGARGPLFGTTPLVAGLRSTTFEATGRGAATSALAISFVPARRATTTPVDKGIMVTRRVMALNRDGTWREVTSSSALSVGTTVKVMLSATSPDYVSDFAITDRLPVAVEVTDRSQTSAQPRPVDMGFEMHGMMGGGRGMVGGGKVMPMGGLRSAGMRGFGGWWWGGAPEYTYGRSDVTCRKSWARSLNCEYQATVTFAADKFWWPPTRGWSGNVAEVFGEGVPLMDLTAVE